MVSNLVLMVASAFTEALELKPWKPQDDYHFSPIKILRATFPSTRCAEQPGDAEVTPIPWNYKPSAQMQAPQRNAGRGREREGMSPTLQSLQ